MSDHDTLKVGILSMGEMGAGIARLLIAHGFPVATNCHGRGEDTIRRARDAGAERLGSDRELVQQCRVILSVVPPRDAEATAQRVIDALAGSGEESDPVYLADLNAVAPSTSKRIAAAIDRARVPVRFVDGCIIGGPPRRKDAADPGTNLSQSEPSDGDWSRPRIPISGPCSLADLPGGAGLSRTLNLRSISPEIGAASGLKMCFASVSKGLTAIQTQAFATAHALGVADELRTEMAATLPRHLAMADVGVPSMVPKAYRWVREMEEIAVTMREEGGWGEELFRGAAGVFGEVAADGVLKGERAGKRARGTTVEDVAEILSDGLQRKKKKMV